MKRSQPISIAEYDPRWPRLFEEEKQRLLAIEHIGSTAVPNLSAKPIVDILAAVRDRAEADVALTLLAAIGYDDGTPQPNHREWFYCLGKWLNEPEVYCHLHLVQAGSDFWRRHILFRDYLRAHSEVACEYDALKRGLAKKFRAERGGYTEAKTEFIEAAIEKAMQV